MRTEIIYEDKELLVIRKPAGLATQSAGVGQADVVSELKNYLARTNGAKGQPYLGIIHRLDQPVEGLLVFAKNKNAAAVLTKQLGGQENSGLLNKQYYAVFCGKPSEKEGVLVDYMYKGPDGKAVIVNKKSVAENSEGQRGAKAVLQYRILQTVTISTGEELSLADIHIETGRFHQIRAQMANAGMALLGDVKYGDEVSENCSARLGIRTVALCAYKIAFSHPASGKLLCFETKPETKAFSFFTLS